MSFPWGIEERQGDYKDVVYVTVPEYQPSSASITLGGLQLYKPSRTAENIAVGRLELTPYIALITIPVAIFAVWWMTKPKKKKRKKKR